RCSHPPSNWSWPFGRRARLAWLASLPRTPDSSTIAPTSTHWPVGRAASTPSPATSGRRSFAPGWTAGSTTGTAPRWPGAPDRLPGIRNLLRQPRDVEILSHVRPDRNWLLPAVGTDCRLGDRPRTTPLGGRSQIPPFLRYTEGHTIYSPKIPERL